MLETLRCEVRRGTAWIALASPGAFERRRLPAAWCSSSQCPHKIAGCSCSHHCVWCCCNVALLLRLFLWLLLFMSLLSWLLLWSLLGLLLLHLLSLLLLLLLLLLLVGGRCWAVVLHSVITAAVVALIRMLLLCGLSSRCALVPCGSSLLLFTLCEHCCTMHAVMWWESE